MLLFNRLGCALAAIVVSVSHGVSRIIDTTFIKIVIST
ncbi:hypothetical protein ECHJAX_0854 [Ehrlichia chaffeensis str. Jax]|nr:hypothetical protein ECHJAX_0854 [Ehrlichia chaffeensis str. Jax]AHX09944.1 hypothetical protein ECHWAK_0853 [Ehrlichia chaffeensis str. Wakulla]